MHCAALHHTRREGRDLRRWNIACDHAINPLLVAAGFELPKGTARSRLCPACRPRKSTPGARRMAARTATARWSTIPAAWAGSMIRPRAAISRSIRVNQASRPSLAAAFPLLPISRGRRRPGSSPRPRPRRPPRPWASAPATPHGRSASRCCPRSIGGTCCAGISRLRRSPTMPGPAEPATHRPRALSARAAPGRCRGRYQWQHR
jgi:hypothetical protein